MPESMPPDLDAALRAGCRAFDRARFWYAHEAWEAGWLPYRGGRGDFLKGLIQTAAVQHHLQRARPTAALALLRRGRVIAHLTGCDPVAWPLDVGTVVAVLAAQQARLERGHRVPPTRLQLTPMLDWW